jgi:HD-like signal output (HDOD) protein
MRLAQELVANQEQLSSLPDLYHKVRQALMDPNLDISDLTDLIAADPALTASLLRLANSAFYGFPRKIETLSRAISLIGLDQVGDIVLTSSLTAAFHGIRPQRMDMKRFWHGSFRRALLCRLFGRNLGSRESERAFVVGLLSDMGHLVMYQAVPDLMGIVLDTAGEGLMEQVDKERSIVGCDYTEVGAALCAAWQLPISVGSVIGNQLTPDQAGPLAPEAARLNLAIAIADALQHGETITAACPLLFDNAADLGQIDLAMLPVFAEHCEAQLESVMGSLGLN